MSAVETPQVPQVPVENPPPAAESSPAVVPGPAAPAAPASPAVPPDPKDLRATIEHGFKQSPRGLHATRQPRKEDGKFAGPPAPLPKPEAAAAPARPQMPKSWNKELESYWNTAPVELLQRFVQREEESARGVEPLKTAKAQLDELLNEFKPYEMLIRSENGTPATVIRNLLQTAALLRTGSPAQKLSLAAQLLQQYGIPIDALQQAMTSTPSGVAPPQPVLDPQVQMLTQQVQQLTNQFQSETEARASAAVAKFAADPAHKHFAALSDRMLVLLQKPEILGPDAAVLPEQDRLQLAYDMALRMDPVLSAQVAAEQQAAAAAEAQARTQTQVAQAKQAAVQVTGAPSAGPAPPVNPKDLRALISNELRRAR